MPALATIGTIVFDCADPAKLGEFYQQVTGWQQTYGDDDTVYLGDGGAVQLGFQRVADYQPPGWPDPGKHAHLDFKVTDLERAVKEVIALGAGRPDFQPGGTDWVVLTDPAGHPFCLVPSE